MPPVYEYKCEQGHRFDVVKRIADLDRPEACPDCAATCGGDHRVMQRFGFTGAGDWNRQEFNHGIGQVATPRQAEKIARARGWEPVGTTKLETIHKEAERTQADRRKAIWDDDRVKLYD